MIEIYTDGACSGNPGPGGFGVAVYKDGELIKTISKRTEDTTNNREELKAIITALELIPSFSPIENFTDIKNYFIVEQIRIYSDSSYCVNICNDWIYTWESNNWTRAKGKPIENLDLIKNLYKHLIKDYKSFIVFIEKIPGHSGIEGNEMADKLARGLIKPDVEELSLRAAPRK